MAEKRDPWWIMPDFGSQHRIGQGEQPPTAEIEWQGPYATFTAARKAMIRAGVIEANEIHSQTRDWRELPKAILLAEMEEAEMEERGWDD